MNRSERFVPSQPRPSLLRRLPRRLRRSLPIVVWCAGALVLAQLLTRRPTHTTVQGIAMSRTHGVTAPQDGRLVRVLVEEGQSVDPGQWIVQFDETLTQERLTEAQHELAALRSELENEEDRLHADFSRSRLELDVDQGRELLRYTRDLEDAHLDHLRTTAELEEARVTIRGVRDEYDRLRGLVSSGIVSEFQLVQVTTEHDALERRIQELVAIQSARSERVESARQRRDDFLALARPELVPLLQRLEPLRHRIASQESVITRLEMERDACRVQASARGIVGPILHRPGETLRRGDLVCTVVEATTHELIAYVPTGLAPRIAPDTTLQVTLKDRPGESRETRVRAMDPIAVPIPEHLRVDPRIETWGLPLRLDPLGDELPGQRLEVIIPNP